MFDYTKAALNKTLSDVKLVVYILNIAVQIIYIAYLIYALIANTGLWYVNALLLALSVAYLIFFLWTTNYGKTPEGKKLKKKVNFINKCSRRLLKLFTVAVAVIDVCQTSNGIHPLSILLTALMIIGWLVQVLFDLLIKIIESRIGFLAEAFQADIDNVLKPVKTVGNFLKKMTGQEVEAEKEPSKRRRFLDEKVNAQKEEKKQARKQAFKDKVFGIKRRNEEQRRKRASIKAENKLLSGSKRKKEDELLSLPKNDDTDGT